MCWEIDYKFFAEQKKAQDARIKQEQRAGVIDGLLNQANEEDRGNFGQRGCTRKIAAVPPAPLRRGFIYHLNSVS
jgi:hypothetical protein